MTTLIKIEYRWWDAETEAPVDDEIRNTLDEEAVSHINEMRQQGYTSGELNYMEHYSGWWSMTTERL